MDKKLLDLGIPSDKISEVLKLIEEETLNTYIKGYDTGFTHGCVSKNKERLSKIANEKGIQGQKCNICGVIVYDIEPTKDPHIHKMVKRDCWGDSAAGYQFCKEHKQFAEEAREQRRLRGF